MSNTSKGGGRTLSLDPQHSSPLPQSSLILQIKSKSLIFTSSIEARHWTMVLRGKSIWTKWEIKLDLYV